VKPPRRRGSFNPLQGTGGVLEIKSTLKRHFVCQKPGKRGIALKNKACYIKGVAGEEKHQRPHTIVNCVYVIKK